MKRAKKVVSILVTLAMLVGLLLPAGSVLAAELEYAKISAGFTYVDDGEKGEAGGTVTIAAGSDLTAGNVGTAVYAEITLPSGVEIGTDPVGSANVGPDLAGATSIGNTDNSATVQITGLVGTPATIEFDSLDIDSGIKGDVVADVKVWSTTGATTNWEATSKVTVAKVASGDVTVSAASSENLVVGSNKAAAKVTVKELSPGALANGGDIFLTIQGSGVKWDTTNMTNANIKELGVSVEAIVAADFTGSSKTLKLTIDAATTNINGRLEITPVFKVEPSATGDVVVKVSGDDVDTTEVTVAKVGAGSVAVEVEKADKDSVYVGQITTMDDVKITLDPASELSDGEYITMTLPEGVKWQDIAAPITDNSANVSFAGLYNSDRTLWLSVDTDEATDVELEDLDIQADYNAKVGDLEVVFGGAVEGTFKIGAVKTPFTVTADPLALTQKSTDVAGSKIVITETDDGAIRVTDGDAVDLAVPDTAPAFFDIVLPLGVSFARTPDVDVETGDLVLGTAILANDDNTLRIPVTTASNLASTIEITNVYYNVDNRVAYGDVVGKIGKEFNMVSGNYVSTFKIGTVADINAVAASYKVGDEGVYLKNGRALVQVNLLMDSLGLQKSWDSATKTAYFTKGGTVVAFPMGENAIYVNGVKVPVDQGGEIINNFTCAPIRAIQTAFGGELAWDQDTQTASFNFLK